MCVLTIILLTFITIPAVQGYLSGYSYGDVVMQVIPFLMDMKRTISEGVPLWTWNQFTGDSFPGIYGYYGLGSPITWPVLLLPYTLIPAGVVFIVYVKAILSALTMRWYLRLMGVKRREAAIGGLMYVFSSTWLMTLFYLIFTDAYILFPLLLGTIELIFRKHKNGWIWATLTVCVYCTSNFYMAFHAGIGVVIYTLVRLFSKEYRAHYLQLLFRVAGAGILGIMLSAFFALPVLLHALQSPRTLLSGGSLSLWEAIILFGVRTFYTFVPRLNEGLPITLPTANVTSMGFWIPVTGVLTALLYMIRNRKDTLSIFTALMYISMYTPLSAIYNGVSSYGYLRGGFLFAVPTILLSLLYLQKYGNPGKKALLWYTAAAITVVVGMRFSGQYSRATEECWIWAEYLLAACSIASMWVMFSGKYSVRRLLYVCIGMIAVYTLIAGKAMSTGSKQDFYHWDSNLHRPVIPDQAPEYVRSREVGFHNSAFTYNSGRALRVPTPYFFNSVSSEATVKLLDGACVRSSWPLEAEPEYVDAFLSVKNHITIDDKDRIICTDAPNYVPMGMAYDRYYYADELPGRRDIYCDRGVRFMLAALELEDSIPEDLKPYLEKWTPELPLIPQMDSIINQRRIHTFNRFIMDTRGFTATVAAPDTAVYMISVPPDPGFSATIDSKPLPFYKVSRGMTAVLIPAGAHTLRFTYMPPGLKAGCLVSGFGVLILIICLSVRRVKNRVKQVGQTEPPA